MGPYELDKETWTFRMTKAREALRGNGVPERVTASSRTVMVSALQDIEYLSFGVRSDLKAKLVAVQRGDLKLSSFGNTRLIAQIERPISYEQVKLKAKKLGLVACAESQDSNRRNASAFDIPASQKKN
jgi:hypothetical protein